MYEVLTRGCAPYSHLLDDEAVSLKVSTPFLESYMSPNGKRMSQC